MLRNPIVEKITSSIGAIITGVDLREDLPQAHIAIIRQAVLDHGVVFFRDQEITIEAFWSFMEHFGQPLKEESTGTEHDTAAEVTKADMAPARYATAVWHADTTSLAMPPIATALRMVSVPPVGGDTCWSNMCDAYDLLSEPMRRMLDGLTAIHSARPILDRMADFGFTAEYTPPLREDQVHPVVITHPETGRKALYVNEAATTRIRELSALESAAILSVLFRHFESPLLTVRWKWSPNDIAFWDNRSVQHFAVPDYQTPRVVQRIVLAGTPPGAKSKLAARMAATEG